jgi:hypothetical protein
MVVKLLYRGLLLLSHCTCENICLILLPEQHHHLKSFNLAHPACLCAKKACNNLNEIKFFNQSDPIQSDTCPAGVVHTIQVHLIVND